MTTLVVGASGATGKLLVDQLLQRDEPVRVIVRDAARVPAHWHADARVTLTQASLLDLSDEALATQVAGCAAVASCLGHNLTFKGIFGKPRRLVTEATRRLCAAIQSHRPARAVRFVLMNTTGNRNRDLDEPHSLAHRAVMALLRRLLPPQADNEQAADHLRVHIGQADPFIHWCAVRPDGLIDAAEVTAYQLHPSPIRDPIFDAGRVSRINVAHFMAALATDAATFDRWRGQMPVVYDGQAD